MAKNNLPKLKQIQGGLQLRTDVNVLQDLFANLTASQVATNIEIPENSGKYYNVAELLKFLNDNASASNSDIDTLQTDVRNLEEVQIADYVRIHGTITTEAVTTDGVTIYTYDAAFDNVEKVAELKAMALQENTSCVLYTEDNTVITNEFGVPVTINLQNGVLSSKLFLADTENVSESEELTYLPITENITFKIFPVGHYTLKTIDRDFLLDNDEMKAVYYQNAIDELAFKLSNNSTILETVQEMIGSKSVAQAIADANAQVTANFQAADTELNNRIDALTSIVNENETDIEAKVSALDARTGDAEDKINVLNAGKDNTGSVLNTVHSITDPISNRVSVTENQITTLNNDVNTPGSVAHSIKTVVDPVKADLNAVTNRVTSTENSITTLNGNEETEGSVANSIKKVVDPVKADLKSVTDRVTVNETNISTNTANISKNERDIASNASAISAIQNSLSGSQEEIVDLTATVNRLDGKEETWDEQSAYTNNTEIVQPIGKIKVGDTFDNVPITEMLNRILYPYVPHVINRFAVDTAGIYEVGEVIEESNASINFSKKSEPIISCTIKVETTKIENEVSVVDNEVLTVDVAELANNSENTYVIEKDITRDAKITLSMSDGTTTLTKDQTIKFYRPAYFGYVDAETDLTNGNVFKEALTKYVQAPSTVKFNYPIITDKILVALVPSNWGITSIKDGNDFDVTQAFTRATIVITCLDGTDVNYNLYYTNKCSLSANATYKFNK